MKPPKVSSTRINMQIPRQLKDLICEQAWKQGIGMSEFIKDAVKKELTRLEKI